MAPKGQASKHQQHPLHLSSSTRTTPVFSSCFNAFRGQTLTHGVSLHKTHAIAMLPTGSKLTTLIRESKGSVLFPLAAEHANSQIKQPKHLSGSQKMNFSCIISHFIAWDSKIIADADINNCRAARANDLQFLILRRFK